MILAYIIGQNSSDSAVSFFFWARKYFAKWVWSSVLIILHYTHHWKRQSAKNKELSIPPIWGCCGPTGGSIFTPGQKNHPAFFEGRWYTGKMARQIWAEWAVCLSSYLWKGWMVFFPRGKNWTSSRSTTTPDRWYWKFFFLANWYFQWCVWSNSTQFLGQEMNVFKACQYQTFFSRI